MERREFLHLSAASSFGALFLTACAGGGSSSSPASTRPDPYQLNPGSVAPLRRVQLGIDVLAASQFATLRGLRCGLVTHRAAVNGLGQRTIDVLANAPAVKLVKLFGPEHGLDSVAKADVKVDHRVDARTGLPIYSLYGETRRPTAAMLAGLDVMVIDLQDIGTRSYTYISCLRYVIEECCKQARPLRVLVLDRPNPLGGEKVDGPFLDRAWRSYVGAYEMPYVHGLTIGEIARWAAATPGVLELDEAMRRRGQVEVMAMQGWARRLTWDRTGLTWLPTSPRIPTPQAAMGYAMVGLGCQLGGFSHTYGEQMHFRFFRYGKRPASEIVAALGAAVPGLRLEPRLMPDGTQGVYAAITDYAQLRPTAISLHMMRQACSWSATNPFAQATKSERELFIKHTGSEAFFEELRTKGARVDLARWLAQWQTEAERFRARTKPFYLYA